MKQAYRSFAFKPETATLIDYIDAMCARYQAQGFMLSVRQIYYQLVARGKIENTERSYKRTASVINDGRLAGMIDWDVIEDRGRDIETRPHWDSGAELIRASAEQFYMDRWVGQEARVFVIVEKAALAGVLGGVCREYDVPLLAARGYPSVSVVRELVQDYLLPCAAEGQSIILLHLGDHDPSGIDMTRDLQDRIKLFMEDEASTLVDRIALTMTQIEEKNPPPNPAKVTDSRFSGYQEAYGSESWELDALEPSYLVDLVTRHISTAIDKDPWDERWQEIEDTRARMSDVADRFEDDEENR